MANTKAKELATARQSERQILANEVETLLLKELAGEFLSTDDYALIAEAFPDRDALDAERGRVAAVAKNKAKAGTAAQRKAAISKYDQACEQRDKRGKEIERTIRELERELGELELAEQLAGKEVTEHQNAVNNLRRLVPKHVTERHRVMVAALSKNVKAPLEKLKSRVATIDRLLTFDPDNHKPHIIAHANGTGRNELLTKPLDLAQTGINREAWAKYRSELEAERADAMKELQPLQVEYDTKRAECDACLDHYLTEK